MQTRVSLRGWYLIQLWIISGLIGYALFLQHRLGLEPCPLCILQRLVFFGLAAVLLVAIVHSPKGWGRRVYGGAGALVALVGVAISAWHVRLQEFARGPGAVVWAGPRFYDGKFSADGYGEDGLSGFWRVCRTIVEFYGAKHACLGINLVCSARKRCPVTAGASIAAVSIVRCRVNNT